MTKTKTDAKAEPTVRVRWIRDPASPAQIHGREYTGRGPVYKRRPRPDGQEVSELVQEGEVQELPADVARVLNEAKYVEVL